MMKKLFEDSQIMNEGVNRPGYNEISRCCANCIHFNEGDRYGGGLDECTIYSDQPPYQKESSEYVREFGICNLFKKLW